MAGDRVLVWIRRLAELDRRVLGPAKLSWGDLRRNQLIVVVGGPFVVADLLALVVGDGTALATLPIVVPALVMATLLVNRRRAARR